LWGELDYLLIDLPPGTGDVQLSLSQMVPLAGAITVTTPQEVALYDVRKGMAMFQKVNVPLLGIIENMSFFLCGHCGERTDIFSHGGGERAAEKLGVPFLGRIPIRPSATAAIAGIRSSPPIRRRLRLRPSGRSPERSWPKSGGLKRAARLSTVCSRKSSNRLRRTD
jgi:MinD superfamily P-loop ATPase